MSGLSYRGRVDLGVAAIVFAVGAFFTWQVSLIEAIAEDAIGPRLIPYFLSISMMVLGVFIAVSAFVFQRRAAQASAPAVSTEAAAEAEAEETFGFRDSDLKRVVGVIAMGFVYVWLFHAFGYFLSTLVSLALMLLVFGNRRLGQIAVLAVVGALAYDYLFMGLMGLYDPPGAYFDLKRTLGID